MNNFSLPINTVAGERENSFPPLSKPRVRMVEYCADVDNHGHKSTGNHADLDGFHVHFVFLQPFDGGVHLGARALQFEADDADLVGHAGLADIGDDLEFMADLPDERLLDELGRIHQPQALLDRGVRFAGGQFFLGHKF
jgi:hypothetical protein